MPSKSGQVCLLADFALAAVLMLAGAALAQPGIPTNVGTRKVMGPMPDPGADSPTSVILAYEAVARASRLPS